MNNIELWKLAEEGFLHKGDIFNDQEDNYIIFTGTSFQSYYEEDEDTYIGLCVGDRWGFVRNEYIE